MSQVDYVHFFSNIVWSGILLGIIYLSICVFYVQNFYKVLRLRNFILNNVFFISKSKLICWLFLSKFFIKLNDNFLNYYFSFISSLLITRKNILKLICI